MENNNPAATSFIIIICLGIFTLMSYISTKGIYDTINCVVDTIYDSLNRVQSQSVERYCGLNNYIYEMYEDLEVLKNDVILKINRLSSEDIVDFDSAELEMDYHRTVNLQSIDITVDDL